MKILSALSIIIGAAFIVIATAMNDVHLGQIGIGIMILANFSKPNNYDSQ